MGFRKLILGTLLTGTLAVGGLAVTAPAWAADGAGHQCVLYANSPKAPRTTISGTGGRTGCSDTVTYFWVRVYKAIPLWPDSEKAVQGRTYVQNIEITPAGQCDGHGEYYTHASTATGTSGDSVESARAQRC